MEEAGAERDTAVDFDFKNLQINFDVENFARGIANEVKKTLKTEIISEMKKEVSIEEYINSRIEFSAIQKNIDIEVKRVRDSINARIKEMFDSSTRQMLSDNILQVLMANETYRKMQENIACIADRRE